jgi:tRNA-specific 2-thiouridylase
MSDLPLVVVAMSGGVDSSVAAALLVEQGYRVVGMMLRLWNEPGRDDENRCCTPDAMNQARRVAAQICIPFYALDARDLFREKVVQAFLDGYSSGLTPNPCVVCNYFVKWGYLFDQAIAVGAELLATGHYARLNKNENGLVELKRAHDLHKDQTYFLSVLDQQRLKHTLFPLGEFTKAEVRELARKFKLEVAEKTDSQDLCFLGHQDYRQFLVRYSPSSVQPGPIINMRGEVVGSHQGLPFYTIGQRKGIEIASQKPLYVLQKDEEKNILVVGPEDELGSFELCASNMNWIAGQPPIDPVQVQAKIRYRAKLAPATIFPLADNRVRVVFDEKMRDITPGQVVVLYNNDIVLGGGLITKYFYRGS